MDDVREKEIGTLHYLGVLGIITRCSPYVPEELRECIQAALHDSPLVAKVERRIDRIDFVTHGGTRSFDAAGDER